MYILLHMVNVAPAGDATARPVACSYDINRLRAVMRAEVELLASEVYEGDWTYLPPFEAGADEWTNGDDLRTITYKIVQCGEI